MSGRKRKDDEVRYRIAFSRRLRKLVADAGDSPVEAAGRTGVSYATMLKYLNGHVMPTAYNIYRICGAYGYSADALFGLEDR